MDGVDKIINKVKKTGDAGLIELTGKYDGITIKNIEVNQNKIQDALKKTDKEFLKTVKESAKNIEDYSMRSMPELSSYYESLSVSIEDRLIPVESVGIYVPGGEYSYPSSVLMSAIPAGVAGVKKIFMVSPPGKLSDAVLAAASVAGVDRVFRVGGAQAVAALAYGTQTIPKVDMVVGPGNSYVQAAKKKLSERNLIGIDMIAGPSEVVIIADKNQSSGIIGIDLMAQAEHAADARATLLTESRSLIEDTEKVINKNFKNRIELIYTKNLNEAVKISNSMAPEHLQVMCGQENLDKIIGKIRNAGAVFVGKDTPVAVGDYWAGPSHTLPTGGASKFSEGLNVRTFLKKVSFMKCTEKGIGKIAGRIEKFALQEGMKYHALSVSERKKKK
jgi:histidinol dehydrogenase